jgi:hypothetical protein
MDISPFSGQLELLERLERRPVAVMIDNDPVTRPQAGLAQADLVFEALVEGGTTRFMAVYLQAEPELVGPVRSARHYFAQIALGLDAIYAHVGGSPQAHQFITEHKMGDFNDVLGTGFGCFWVDKNKKRPYSTFTSVPMLREKAEQRGFRAGGVPDQLFSFRSGDQALAGDPVTNLTIHYPGYLQTRVGYRYTPSGDYLRYVGGQPHRDAATGEQLRADNILVLYVETWAIPGDQQDRIDMDLVGSGALDCFSGGHLYTGTWSKASVSAPLKFQGQQGRLELTAGKTWIQIVPVGTKIESE